MSKQLDGDEPLLRLTVSVSASQVDALKLAARRSGTSVSEVVRGAVDDLLEKAEPRPLPSLLGAFQGPGDLSMRVDETIREGMAERFKQKMGYDIDDYS